jgi:hypothetical protein
VFKLTTNDAEGLTPGIRQSLDGLVREGARHMFAGALEGEVKRHTEALRQLRDESDRALSLAARSRRPYLHLSGPVHKD